MTIKDVRLPDGISLECFDSLPNVPDVPDFYAQWASYGGYPDVVLSRRLNRSPKTNGKSRFRRKLRRFL